MDFRKKNGGLEGVENAMKHIPSDMQVFTMSPMTKAGLYTGGVIVSGWNGDQNATYVVNLGTKSDRLDQGYLITPDFIEKQLPALIDNIDDINPEVPEVFIEVLPEDKKPLLPQTKEQIITDLGQSPGVYIPKTLEIDKTESAVLKEQPRVSVPRKIVRTLEAPKMPKPKESVGQRLPKHILPRYVLRPGQPFLYPIPSDTSDEFFIVLGGIANHQKGMYFLYESTSINWVPTDNK